MSIEFRIPTVEISITPRCMKAISEYLTPNEIRSLRCVSVAFSVLCRDSSNSSICEWNNWYVQVPHRFCFMTPQMATVLVNHTLSFLNPIDFTKLGNTNRDWREFTNSYSKARAISYSFIPETLITPKSWNEICQLTKDSFGPKFYEQYFGEVGPVPPIPHKFVERAHEPDLMDDLDPGKEIMHHYQLMLIPASITISVSGNSPLSLNSSNSLVEGIKGEDTENRFLKVPLTLNNLAVLIDKCLKQVQPMRFHPNCWPNIFEQLGDEPVSHSHWVYQKRNSILRGYSSSSQETIAKSAGMKIVELLDRVVFNILSKIRFGNFVDNETPVTTHSTAIDNDVVPRACFTTIQGLTLSNTLNGGIPVAVEILPEDGNAPINVKNFFLKHEKSM